MSKKIVEIIGKVFDNHSLAIVTRKMAIELSKNENFEVVINPLDTYDPQYNLASSELKELKALIKPVNTEPDIQIRHSYPPIWRWPVSDKTKIVQIQPWEYKKLPFEWQYKFETFADLVITPSSWTAKVFLDAGLMPSKVAVVPNGYDPKHFNTSNKKPNDKFTFVYVGNAQWRKGLNILLQAWSSSFKKEESVKLVIKDNPAVYGNYNLLQQLVKLQYETGCAEIEYNDKQLSEIDMSRIYKSAHCLVHPYRGEGFGMHIQEAMACGLVPLVSDKGPTDDFVKDERCRIKVNPTVVKADDPNVMMMKPGDALTSMGGHAVAFEPDVNDLVTKMRQAYQGDLSPIDYSLDITTWKEVGLKYAEVINSIDLSTPAARLQTQGWRTT
jgi:glycosyltransferase involved in cell wall biosynthesis